MAFTAVVIFEMIRLLDIRAEYKLPPFSNKYLVLAVLTSITLQLMLLYAPVNIAGYTLQALFKVQPILFKDWLVLLSVGGILFVAMLFLSRKKNAPAVA